MSDVKKTLIEEALIDYDIVLKEAQEIAKEQLATAMPDKFETLVEEHLKNKNKINESDENQEPVVADEKESVKESQVDGIQEMSTSENVDMTGASIDDIEEAYDNLSLDEIEIVRDGEGYDDDISVNDIESEINSMSEMVDDLETVEEPVVAEDSNDPYSKLKEMHEQMSKMLEAIESEKIQEGKELPKSSPEAKPADEKKVGGGMNKGHNLATAKKGAAYSKSTPPTAEPAEEKLAETKELPKTSPEAKPADEKKVGGGMNKGHNLATSKKGAGYSKSTPSTAEPAKEHLAEVEEVADDVVAEEQVAEGGHGHALSHNKLTGAEKQPRIDQGKEYAKDRVRLALQKESEDKAKQIAALLKEQKELTKKFNELKKQKNELVGINEGFKKTLNEMKDQMKKMAVFNSNIAHVNNLLVNEELALTKDEKIYIINKFKNVASISESDATHKTLLEEFKTSKKKLVESTEKITESVAGESSANILESRVVEKTAFEKHIDKVKDIMSKVERRKK